jgi:hypothetical protein
MANHLECGRNAFKLLGYILAELAQSAAAIGAPVVRGKIIDDFALTVFRAALRFR